MDAYAKTVLTVIAACLALQVAQGFGLGATPVPEEVTSRKAIPGGRYQMVPVNMARLLFRIDRETGKTWTMPLQPGEDRLWTLVRDAPRGQKARKKSKKAPSQPKSDAGNAKSDAGDAEKPTE